jgi:hypothetical protein
MNRAQRHTRQARLAGVGAAGQASLAAAEVSVAGAGLAAEVEARYLAGAGIGAIRVASDGVAEAARALGDSEVRVTIAPELASAAAMKLADLGASDAAARAVAEGAHRALVAIRTALASGGHS